MVLRQQTDIIKGSKLMIFMEVLSELTPIGFATNHLFSKQLNTIEISSINDGSYTAFLPQNYSWTMQTDNLYSINGYKLLHYAFKTKRKVLVCFGESNYNQTQMQDSIVDVNGASDWEPDSFVEQGYAYITSLEVTSAAGENATLSATFVGVSELVEVNYHNYYNDYLTFEAIDDTTFTLSQRNTANRIQYSLDNGTTWTWLDDNVASPIVYSGDKIIWKASAFRDNYLPGIHTDSINGIGTFTSTGKFNVSGNVMSLIYADNFIGNNSLSPLPDNAFSSLFKDNTNLIDASNLILPATTLQPYCYRRMFSGCTSLVAIPKLPATTLWYQCYQQMFENCTSLTYAPELPATTLANTCYMDMFNGCSALTTAPELPATTLTKWCYRNMFKNCTSLKYIKCLATDISAEYCLLEWVQNVSSTGTFVKDTNTTWASGDSGIPNNWTIENI